MQPAADVQPSHVIAITSSTTSCIAYGMAKARSLRCVLCACAGRSLGGSRANNEHHLASLTQRPDLSDRGHSEISRPQRDHSESGQTLAIEATARSQRDHSETTQRPDLSEIDHSEITARSRGELTRRRHSVRLVRLVRPAFVVLVHTIELHRRIERSPLSPPARLGKVFEQRGG